MDGTRRYDEALGQVPRAEHASIAIRGSPWVRPPQGIDVMVC
jgi:hypothetical protein